MDLLTFRREHRTCACATTDCGSNGRAFSTTGNRTDGRTETGAATDDCGIPFLCWFRDS